MSVTLDKVPSDILIKIANKLTIQEYLEMSTVSKRLNNCLTYGSYWSKSSENKQTYKQLKIEKLKKHLAKVKVNGRDIRYIINPSVVVQLEAIKQNIDVIYWLPKSCIEVRLAVVKQCGEYINIFGEEIEEVQIAAVKNAACKEAILAHIRKPTEKVQFLAIKQHGFNIRFVPDPSEKMQLVAVKQNRNVIKYIKNPTQKVLDFLK